MKYLSATHCVAALVAASTSCYADGVRLSNGDIVTGEVLSLDENTLTLSSENFGELKIPRDRIEMIGLGENAAKALSPQPVQAPQAGGATNQATGRNLPSLQNPAMQRQVDQILGRIFSQQDMGNLSEQAGRARDSLKDLSRDMEGPEGQAIDSYLQMFNLIAPPAAEEPSNSEQPPTSEQPEASDSAPDPRAEQNQ